jgi:tRNA pseudouridine32 synthase / 23S rRNA pseudouridine746 synthase
MADILQLVTQWFFTMYEIIENHPDFVVIYKKPDTSFHSESGSPGVFETLKQREGFEELFPVHRLDKVTSGLLVMAKNAAANRALTQAFANREVEKFYLAISAKKPQKKQGLVKGDMAPARRGAWKLLPGNENPAVTQFFNKGLGEGLRLFIVKPHTGKTHQIRVALKSLGAPIVGDELYGGKTPADRVYLHALSLGFLLNGERYRFFVLPREGEHFCSPIFTATMEEWCTPWELLWPELKIKKPQ